MRRSRGLHVPALLRELRRRKVYSVVAAYAVAGWILLQIGEVTFGPLGVPDWVMTALVVCVIVGFPIVVVLAWVFELAPGGIRKDQGSSDGTPGDRATPSIAVLPFADMSPQRDQAYFCEGVAEEILNALSKIDALQVAARSSSFQYGDRQADVRHIGRELGVTTVLEGSVRKAGDRLRVNVELVNVADGFHLWSRTFDKQVEDVFDIQDEIAQCIVQALLETITPAQQFAIKTASSKDVVAYEYYLRGRQFVNRFRKTDIQFARQMFRQAIDLDPTFAKAWAGYADCYSMLVMYAEPRAEYQHEATRASQRALDLAPDLAEAHASRGLACLVCKEYAEAETHFEEAQRLNPALFEAFYYHARTRFHQGDLEEAAELFSKAAAVNPADYQSRCLRVQILRGLGNLEQARREAIDGIEVLDKHLEWNPDDVRALHLGAGSLIVAGQVDRAREWLRRALEIDPNDSILLYNVACNFATLGEVEAALDYLERAIDNGMVSLAWMLNDTDLDNLRDHPRFHSLAQRLRTMMEEKANSPT